MSARICAVCRQRVSRQFYVTVEGVNEGKTSRPHSLQVLAVCGMDLEATWRAVVALVREHQDEILEVARKPAPQPPPTLFGARP